MYVRIGCDLKNGGYQLIDFHRIYETDLRYIRDCWKLCGDAHCCSFSRYKANFKLIAQTHVQELPLLPGEYEFLEENGWTAQFQDFEHKVIAYQLDDRVIRIESIVSRRPNCACDQATRTTICRLYPMLPVLEISGKFVGVDRIGLYEELEALGDLIPACRVDTLPINEMDKLLTIVTAIASSPTAVYQLMAYRLAKNHVFTRLARDRKNSTVDVFSQFEMAFLRKRLFDHETLRRDLIDLADAFKAQYGEQFDLA